MVYEYTLGICTISSTLGPAKMARLHQAPGYGSRDLAPHTLWVSGAARTSWKRRFVLLVLSALLIGRGMKEMASPYIR